MSSGDRIRANQPFAVVGPSDHNGGWFPHLHVQVIPEGRYHSLSLKGFRELDGYGYPIDFWKLGRENPDPMQYVNLGT